MERSAEFLRGALWQWGHGGLRADIIDSLAAAEVHEAWEGQALPLAELQRKHGELACELLSAAEVIEAAERALKCGKWESFTRDEREMLAEALSLIARYKEAHGGK